MPLTPEPVQAVPDTMRIILADPDPSKKKRAPIVEVALPAPMRVGADGQPVPEEEYVLKMRKLLGIKAKSHLRTAAKIRAAYEFGSMATEPLTARMLWVDEFNNLARLDEIIKIGTEEGKNSDLAPELRQGFCRVVVQAVEAQQKLIAQTMELSAKANLPKTEPAKKRNLPPELPQVNLQVNVGDKAVKAAKATNGQSADISRNPEE